MRHTLCVALGLLMLGSGARAFAQDNTTGRCTTPDSVAVTGNSRVTETDVRASAGLVAGVPLNARSVQEAVRSLFATGQFDDVQITCTSTEKRALITIAVKERLLTMRNSYGFAGWMNVHGVVSESLGTSTSIR